MQKGIAPSVTLGTGKTVTPTQPEASSRRAKLNNSDCTQILWLAKQNLIRFGCKKSYAWGMHERVNYNKWMAVIEHLPARKITGKWGVYARGQKKHHLANNIRFPLTSQAGHMFRGNDTTETRCPIADMLYGTKVMKWRTPIYLLMDFWLKKLYYQGNWLSFSVYIIE